MEEDVYASYQLIAVRCDSCKVYTAQIYGDKLVDQWRCLGVVPNCNKCDGQGDWAFIIADGFLLVTESVECVS